MNTEVKIHYRYFIYNFRLKAEKNTEYYKY